MYVFMGMVRNALSKNTVHPPASCYRKCDKEMLYTLCFLFALSHHRSARSTHIHKPAPSTPTLEQLSLHRHCCCPVMFVCDFQSGSWSFCLATHTYGTHFLINKKLASVGVTEPDTEWHLVSSSVDREGPY